MSHKVNLDIRLPPHMKYVKVKVAEGGWSATTQIYAQNTRHIHLLQLSRSTVKLSFSLI